MSLLLSHFCLLLLIWKITRVTVVMLALPIEVMNTQYAGGAGAELVAADVGKIYVEGMKDVHVLRSM